MIEKIKIIGQQKMSGKTVISGAKNAALPLMAASLLTDEVLVLKNMPLLTDILTFIELFNTFGMHSKAFIDDDSTNLLHVGHDCDGEYGINTLNYMHKFYSNYAMCNKNLNKYSMTFHLHAQNVTNTIAEYEIVKKMRASILVLGPLLARYGKCRVSLPGGCAIGVRPVDLHLKAMQALGACIEIESGYINAFVNGRLQGAEFEFPIVTVTGTENMIMAAVLANGTSVIRNAAQEPEIIDLCKCLNQMGARISGHGTNTIVIDGVDELHGTIYSVLPDRMEAFTYACGAVLTGGEVELVTNSDSLQYPLDVLRKVGAKVVDNKNSVLIKMENDIQPINIQTAPYPGFPTDMQAQLMTVLTSAKGESIIDENIWENRFMHVPELIRMGAEISVNGNKAVIHGYNKLKAAPVMATDLRASFSLVIAAVAAEGVSVIDRIYHLKRGYSFMKEKMADLNVDVEFFY